MQSLARARQARQVRQTRQIDVFIAGAGPAGLACAIACAVQGLEVHIADAMEPPIDKACGEGLLPDAMEALARLGLDLVHGPTTHEAHSIPGVRFHGIDGETVQALFKTPGRGIRRTILHQLLLDRAIALGVQFHWKNSVQNIEPTPTGSVIRTNRQLLYARFVVGADGHHSRVAACAGLTEATVHSRRIGLRQHYAVKPWTDFVEVYWSNFGQAYVTPNSSGEVCVAFIADKKIPSPQMALSHFPALAHHLALAQCSGPARGSITLGRKLRRVTIGNVALIGDASGSVDAITGQGLALSFHQAAALAPALKNNNLTFYQDAHRRIQRQPTLMSRSLLLLDRLPFLRDNALHLFHRHPVLFERLLQFHVGQSPLQLFPINSHLHPDYTCRAT